MALELRRKKFHVAAHAIAHEVFIKCKKLKAKNSFRTSLMQQGFSGAIFKYFY